MSILTRPLQDSVVIDGKQYPIRTGFREWIEIGQILSSRGEMNTRIVEALKLCYFRDSLPPEIAAATYAMIDFYAGTQKPCTEKGTEGKRKEPIYDFEYDSEYIFAAFMAQYGIDLTQTDLHWHKFKALFLGLDENNKICKIMEYRGMELSKIKDKEQRAFYRRMKHLYRLPDMRTEEEKEQDMIRALEGVF